METRPEQLVAQASRGDATATNCLIEMYYERIYAFLRRLSGSDHEAADLTQKTFARTWSALAKFAGRSTFNSWLHGIAHHVYLDWRRANHRSEQRPEQWWAEQVSPEPPPDIASATSDLTRQLYKSVDELSPEVRNAVHLHYYQELTLQETADALDIATSTLKYRLRNALDELARRLTDKPAYPKLTATPR